jgi:hypothetical protein
VSRFCEAPDVRGPHEGIEVRACVLRDRVSGRQRTLVLAGPQFWPCMPGSTGLQRQNHEGSSKRTVLDGNYGHKVQARCELSRAGAR